MLYALLCYQDEARIGAMDHHEALLPQRALLDGGPGCGVKLGPLVRMMPSSAAVTVRGGREPIVLDGPFAASRDQLLGFSVIECESLQAAIDAARAMLDPGGALEIRPLRSLERGDLRPADR